MGGNRKVPRERMRSRFGIVAVLSCAVTMAACTHLSGEEQDVQSLTQSLQSEPTLPGESASPSPISIVWRNRSPEIKTQLLQAELANNTSQELFVTLELVASGLDGRVVSRPYGQRRLQAGATSLVSIPVHDIPVQSAGMSSMFMLVADYSLTIDLSEPLPSALALGATEITQRSSSAPRRVTFDTDFGAATIRTNSAQAALSTPPYDDATQRQQQVIGRIFDPNSGVFRNFGELLASASDQQAEDIPIMNEPYDMPSTGSSADPVVQEAP